MPSLSLLRGARLRLRDHLVATEGILALDQEKIPHVPRLDGHSDGAAAFKETPPITSEEGLDGAK
jgi:hypothetical protein